MATYVCERLADVYYYFVRKYGGSDATNSNTRRDDQKQLERDYQNAVAQYEVAVKKAQAEGLLPMLD